MTLQATKPAGRGQMTAATSAERPFEAELRFTETFRRYQEAHLAIREASCLAAQYPEICSSIEGADLFAGRIQPRLVGFSPDEWGSCAFGYYHLPQAIEQAMERYPLDPPGRRRVQAMLEFWNAHNTSAQVRAAYPPAMARELPTDDWMNQPGIAFPLYRLTGANVDCGRLMRLGLPGMIAEIRQRYRRAAVDGADAQRYEGMLIALDVLVAVCRHYEQQALGRRPDALGRRAAGPVHVRARAPAGRQSSGAAHLPRHQRPCRSAEARGDHRRRRPVSLRLQSN